MKKTSLLAFIFLTLATAYGQTKLPVIRISEFSGEGVSVSEIAMIERLINSYVAELKLFRIIDASGQELALAETETALRLGSTSVASIPLTADFIISGMLGKIENLFILTLENTRVSSGEKLSVSDTAFSVSDIVFRARNLTRSLLGKQEISQVSTVMPAQKTASSPVGETIPSEGVSVFRSPTMQNLSGTWKGDKGLENVRLLPGGTGIAVLSGGGTMKLRITLNDDRITISQDQPNSIAMYKSTSISFDLAKKISTQARPMRWIFTLSSDGLQLRGTKESVSISGDSTTLKIDNSYEREAAWVRISR